MREVPSIRRTRQASSCKNDGKLKSRQNEKSANPKEL